MLVFNSFFVMAFLLNLILLFLFFLASKFLKLDSMVSSIFECGFTSYFYSRFSFSIHYFLIALIFLFLDLELCFIMPLFNEFLSSFSSFFGVSVLTILLLGLVLEWYQGKLDWIF